MDPQRSQPQNPRTEKVQLKTPTEQQKTDPSAIGAEINKNTRASGVVFCGLQSDKRTCSNKFKEVFLSPILWIGICQSDAMASDNI